MLTPLLNNVMDFVSVGFPIISTAGYIISFLVLFLVGRQIKGSLKPNLLLLILLIYNMIVAWIVMIGPAFIRRVGVGLYGVTSMGFLFAGSGSPLFGRAYFVAAIVFFFDQLGSNMLQNYSAPVGDVTVGDCLGYLFNARAISDLCKDDGYLQFARVIATFAIYTTAVSAIATLSTLTEGSSSATAPAPTPADSHKPAPRHQASAAATPAGDVDVVAV